MEEEISTTGPTDFEDILILTRRISLRKNNSVPKTSRSLNTVKHHASRIYASISIFTPYKPRQYFMKLFSCFWLDSKYEMIYRCEIFKLLTYCLHFLCICSLGDCLQMVKNFFL